MTTQITLGDNSNEVFNTLFPQDNDSRVRFVNTIPLVIHLTAGVKIIQLLKELLEKPREQILTLIVARRSALKGAIGC